MTDDRIKINEPTVKEALYHMTIVMKQMTSDLGHMSEEINNINIQLNELKRNPNEYLSISTPAKERLKDGSLGGAVGAGITALVTSLWEVFKQTGQ